jgi:hypothetical protein
VPAASQAPPRIDEPPPSALKQPSGIALIDAMCLAADRRDRTAAILELSRTISALQAAHDARCFQLESEIKRLEDAVKKAESQPDFDDLQNALVDRFGPDDKGTKKAKKKV